MLSLWPSSASWGPAPQRARRWLTWAFLANDQGRYDEAAEYYAQALAIAREVGDRATEGMTLNNLGVLARDQGQYDEAAEYYAQSLAIKRELGDQLGVANTLYNLGELARDQGHLDSAREHFSQALGLYTTLGVPEADKARSELADLAPDPEAPPSGIPEEAAPVTPPDAPESAESPTPPRQRDIWPWQH